MGFDVGLERTTDVGFGQMEESFRMTIIDQE